MSYIKPFEELCFYDDFMFGVIMQDKDICREALECMLGFKIDRIEYSESHFLSIADGNPRFDHKSAGVTVTHL